MKQRPRHSFSKKWTALTFLPFLLSSCGNIPVGNVRFDYQSSKGDFNTDLFFADDYFSKPSTEYNPSLATASLSFAMASFASIKESNITKLTRYVNIENLLGNVGFKDFVANGDYHKKSGTDTIGLVFAHKEIDGTPLVYVGIRGAGYEAEWASNLTIADPSDGKLREDGFHFGFRKAADQFISELKDYLSSKNIKGDIKLWTSGYSRAGATANIASGLIDQSIENGTKILGEEVNLKKENFYSYCFEPPMGAPMKEDAQGFLLARKDTYSNIFNHVNFNDLVPLVAMKEVEFTRFGNDRYFPDRVSYLNPSKEKSDMKRILESLPNYKLSFVNGYPIDNFRVKTLKGLKLIDDPNALSWTEGLYLREFISELTKFGLGASSREKAMEAKTSYVEKLQPAFRTIFDIIYRSGNFKGSLIDLGVSMINDIISIFDLDTLINDFFVAEQRKYLVQDLTVIVNRGLEKFGIMFPLEEVKPKVQAFIKMLADFGGDVITKGLFQIIFTLFSKANLSCLGTGHYPELCLAEIRALDPNYVNEPFKNTNPDGKYFTVSLPDQNAKMSIFEGGHEIVNVDNGVVYVADVPTRIDVTGVDAILPYGPQYEVKVFTDSEVDVTLCDYHYYDFYLDVDVCSQKTFTLS